jgi:hypothetical protein
MNDMSNTTPIIRLMNGHAYKYTFRSTLTPSGSLWESTVHFIVNGCKDGMYYVTYDNGCDGLLSVGSPMEQESYLLSGLPYGVDQRERNSPHATLVIREIDFETADGKQHNRKFTCHVRGDDFWNSITRNGHLPGSEPAERNLIMTAAQYAIDGTSVKKIGRWARQSGR